jgi:hypothetical protein
MFPAHFIGLDVSSRFYVVSLDGSPLREILAEFLRQHDLYAISTAWHPDGRRISVLVADPAPSLVLWTMALAVDDVDTRLIADSFEKVEKYKPPNWNR